MWTAPSTLRLPGLPLSVTPATLANLGAYVRDLYRLHFTHELLTGARKPLIIPYAILGTFILPLLYLTIPHVRRPWLHRARVPLWLAIVAFNLTEAQTTSSANFAIGYATGLMQAWGVLWCGTLLVWMDPQFEAERVERRRRVSGGSAANGGARVALVTGSERVGGNGHAAANGHRIESVDGVVDQQLPLTDTMSVLDAPDEDVAKSLKDGYEYYWQSYPADEPFATRLEWSCDLVSSFRGTGKLSASPLPLFLLSTGLSFVTECCLMILYGVRLCWNWGVPVLPRFAKAEKPNTGSTVDLHSIPLVTRQGFRRYKTGREWIRARTVPIILEYLALDLLSTLMMKDPYFILGPEVAASYIAIAPQALPPLLAALPFPVLFVYRALLCFPALLVAIDLIMTFAQMFAYFALGPRILGTRAELWHYPCVYGGFTPCVLEKGMAGFWGGWWHQTFRIAFSAPGEWLSRHGYIDRASAGGKALAGALAFASSGFLHSMGSFTCLPPSKPYLPTAFFVLSWVGILVQTTLAGGLRASGLRDRTPVWARRMGNFVFAFVWLVYFQHLFSDDLARTGIWMLEPVPASLARGLGLGKPGDGWWRWDAFHWPRWHVGGTWLESGITI